MSWANMVRGKTTPQEFTTPKKSRKPRNNINRSNFKFKKDTITKICECLSENSDLFVAKFHDRRHNKPSIVFSFNEDVNNGYILQNKFTIHFAYINRPYRRQMNNGRYLSQIHFKGNYRDKSTWINIYTNEEGINYSFNKNVENKLSDDELDKFYSLFDYFMDCMERLYKKNEENFY